MSELTLGQQRARHALDCIKGIQGQRYGKYQSYVKSLPATILNCGLGQAAAMLLSSAKLGKTGRNEDNRAYETLYNHLSDWLCRDDPNGNAPYPKGDLMEAIVGNDQEQYMHAQVEALAYLEWLKKFAVALLKEAR